MQYLIGNVRIDENRFELTRNGHTVPIEPRPLELIVYLVRHRARIVSKQELLDEVWQGTCVVDSVIPRCVCLARQALGDPSLIQTVYGRGYRWTGRITATEERRSDSVNAI